MPDMPEMKGDGVDMNALMKMFAMKSPPDNTIVRIQALEDALKKLPKEVSISSGPLTINNPNVASSGPGLDQDALDRINDLMRRVQTLETRADKTDRTMGDHDDKLADHERRITALEGIEMAPSGVTVTGEIDSDAILK